MVSAQQQQEISGLLKARRTDEARALVRAALAADDRDEAMLALAGMLAAQAGDAADAAIHLAKLLARRPDDRATRLNLAQAHIATGAFERVSPLFDGQPRDPAMDRIEAYAALRTGAWERARMLYKSVLKATPADADSWANLASACMAAGDVQAAITSLEEAITLRRGDVRFYLALADVLDRAERPVERLRVAADAAALAPNDPAVQLALGLAHAAMDDMPSAETALRRAIDLAPADPGAYLELGLLLETHNRLEALDTLIASAAPRLGDELNLLRAWSALRARRIDQAAAFAQAIPSSISPLRRYQVQAQIAARGEDPAVAFALFERMNAAALAEAAEPPEPSYRATVEAETAALMRAKLAPNAAPVPGAPIFVLGFPRSGTTLVDTLLGRLPNTHVLEEQPLISAVQRSIGSIDEVLALEPSDAAGLRDRYHELLERQVPGGSAMRIVDKHPLHMTRMPLIDRMFPGAPILLVERHPCDVVLSCFMANFRLNLAMRSFTVLHEAALTYDAVFTAWREAEARLSLNVHRVRYERLVAAPEAEMRAALDFLGATFNADVLDNVAAAQERGRIRTASYAQVTEPIYQSAVSRWTQYRDQLSPVIPILAPWVERLGYEL